MGMSDEYDAIYVVASRAFFGPVERHGYGANTVGPARWDWSRFVLQKL